MNEICPRCGLNQELCVCEAIAKEEQKIKVMLVKRRFGKMITLIDGINKRDINIKELAKNLKSKFACGGTMKQGKIELQGNHLDKVKKYLVELGFSSDTIKVE